MKEKKVLTKTGYERLTKKLASFLEKRKRLVIELEETRAMGDLAENSAYHSLRNRLVILDDQIDEIKMILANAQIVSGNNGNKKTVGLGSKIKVSFNGSAKELEIVGDGEADPLKGKVSFSSPIAKALMGKRKGSETKLATPGGGVVYRILSIKN